MIPEMLSTLGHPGRLAVFRLLMRRYPDQVPAGEIASALELKASTLSAYLAALMATGLVRQERRATSLLYAIDMSVARRLIGSLLIDFCRGRPELCLPGCGTRPEGNDTMSERKYNVLFICTGNSARSIFAESILRKEAGERFTVYSAGTRPTSELNPFAMRVLEDKDIDTSKLRSKNVSEFQGADAIPMDFVFTVCNQAANEECPAWDGQPVSAHWGMPDPVKAEGSDAQKSLAFQQAYGMLRNRIVAFASLPLDSLDAISLQNAVDDIGRTEASVGA